MGRGRVRRTAIVAGVACIVLISSFYLVMQFTAPHSSPSAVSIEAKSIPPDWAAARDRDLLGSEGRVATSGEPQTASTTVRRAWHTTGTLVFFASDKPLGEENFELSVAEAGISLRSSGRFGFRLLVATVNVTFEQRLEMDGALRLESYRLDVHAPFGRGEHVRGERDGNQFSIVRNDEAQVVGIDPDRTALLGMFATYALLPVLFDEREIDGRMSLDLLLLGGPPGSQDAASDTPPTLTLERGDPAILAAGDIRLQVDRYRVFGPLGESTLLARGREFLALLAGDGKDSLLVYRADYFPQGFQFLVDAE